MIRILGRLALLTCLIMAVEKPSPAAEAPVKSPNILFLFTDDQRADTISALGNPDIKTPHLDELARQAFVFRNAFCFGGNVPAVCLPSRTMLMNGRVFFRWGQKTDAAEPPNFPTAMKTAGYQTYHHGKNGNVPKDINRQFEVNQYVDGDVKARTSGEPGKEIVDSAIQFLKSRTDERPFFMYLAFAVPHDPRVADERYMAMYQRERIPLPKNYLPVHPFDNGEMVIRDEQLASWPRTEEEVRRHLHDYYATITGFDGHVGRLLESLREQNLSDNTIIVYSSDHGLAMGSHGLMGKQNLYEDGMKPPLLFAGPGIPRGETDALVYLHDIFPTVCELVGASAPSGIDGLSLAPVIRGSAARVRDSLFTAYRDSQRAVRDQRWKLIRYPQINRSQLFDLHTDPHEIRDLAAMPENKERLETLLALMQQWQRKVGDDLPLTSAAPKDPTFTIPSATELSKKPRKKG
jgi:arylsulfatase A-like enzyme